MKLFDDRSCPIGDPCGAGYVRSCKGERTLKCSGLLGSDAIMFYLEGANTSLKQATISFCRATKILVVFDRVFCLP